MARSCVVRTESGVVRGYAAEGVVAFKGVPYAAPPLGPLRWRPPQPVAPWKGVRDATVFGHDFMQKPFPSDAAPLGTTPGEDGLTGNIWAPEHHAGRLPILIWIHGGGWVNGGSSPAVYDGASFARQGLLFYSFNYRLGRFGFFAHPALTVEGGDGLLGNYGYMDQIAALRWIRANAPAFGGDPENVTVFGESAGGFAVHMLMTTPLAAGLFQRVIVQSGGGRTLLDATGVRAGRHGRPPAEALGVAFAARHGIHGTGPEALRRLRALPAAALVDGLNLDTLHEHADTYAGPMFDGRIVTDEIEDAYRGAKNQKLPMIVGANARDLSLNTANTREQLFAAFGGRATAARRAYDPVATADLAELRQAVGSDALMLEPARFIARTVAAQGSPVWAYRFGYVATSMRAEWPAAPHATEIPYIFNTVRAKYGSALTPEDERTAATAHAYWCQFAKTGDPNGPGLPVWPAYDPGADVLLDFALDGAKAHPDLWHARLDCAELAAESRPSA